MKAVIYCRVSTKEQVENLSLETQERACKDYCDRAGIDDYDVFVDRGESAKTADRPQFIRALAAARAGGVAFFVVYNLSRFARSTHDHAIIGARLKASGVTLRSVTEPIDDSSTGRLMESILAGFAQFDNDVRADRTKAGMKAALGRGRWPWRPPPGYLKGMVPDPERAPLIRRAFELAATWTGTAEELRREVGRLGLTTPRGRPVPRMTLFRLLRNPLYSGTLRSKGWGLEAKAAFEPLVDEVTFARAQAGMKGRVQVPRRRLNPDFPLRRFVRCGPCGTPLTGYFATGRRGGRFGYYRCARCNGVSIRREKLEVEFVNLLDSVALRPELLDALRRDVLAEWERTHAEAEATREAKDRQARAIREKKSRLLDAYLAREVDPVAYRAKLAEIDDALAVASVEAVDAVVEAAEVEGALAYAEHALGRPGAFWTQASGIGRRGFAEAVFPAGLTYYPEKGFANPVISPIFKSLRPDSGGKVDLAALPGGHANPLGPLIAMFRACRAA